ncbi:MAG TPA: GNAT family N-acetyltransferase [Candidatus Bathyarchaeia archaeon]|nr:GNAT family N-acetyltransferase [Candidatus Bathyarchaeia archaeon]
MNALPTLKTERLVLRAVTEADARALFEIFSDPQVMRFWSRPPMASIDEAVSLVREIESGWHTRTLLQWGITLKSEGLVIGTCTLYRWDRTHRRAELGYVLRRDRWGSGIASEAVRAVLDHAFGEMGLHRVGADTDPRNVASARLLVRLGFEREGLQRETYFHLGEWADSELWGLLARDKD